MINKELVQILEKYDANTKILFFNHKDKYTYLSVGYGSYYNTSLKIVSLHKNTSSIVVISPEPNKIYANITVKQVIEQLNQYNEYWNVLTPNILEHKYDSIAFIANTQLNKSIIISAK